MDQGDHQTPLLPIAAGIDCQWVEENWDPRATLLQASQSTLPEDFFSANISSDWYPCVDTNSLANDAQWDGFPIGYSMSTSVLWDGQNAGDLATAPEPLNVSPSQAQQGMVGTASPQRQNGKAKTQKPRIPCSHPGCKKTFPRNYELERHRRNIHKRDINVNCSVYGCSRISKPFHRMDKLGEHMRRHHANPSQFLYVLEDCRLGQFSTDELITHLNKQHPFRKNTPVEFDQILNLVHLRETPLKDGTTFVERGCDCPLTFLGCKSKNKAYVEKRSRILRRHILSHDLLERSRGYEAIKKAVAYWPSVGAATCPICRLQVGGIQSHISTFLNHIGSHSREERILHASTLAQIFRPYLTAKECAYVNDDIFDKLKIELEEAGFGTDGSDKITENDLEL